MKLILVLVSLLALVYSSKALQCYKCKTPDFSSSDHRFQDLQLCDNDMSKSPKFDVPNLGFPKCMKILEKIITSGRENTLTLRTYSNDENFQLNSTIFQVHTCNTDLCNSATYSRSAWFVVFAAIILVISSFI